MLRPLVRLLILPALRPTAVFALARAAQRAPAGPDRSAGLLIGGGIAGVLLVTGSAAGALGILWAAITFWMIWLAPACPGPAGGAATA